ncbi:DegT/DnrJ/EryC1/StrS family aminotransferase [Myxococcota bacterium]|nr:DegT/DnrJ/EryC1/StrS family aminotransferase [Myxococcota bacterium]
MSIPFVDLKSQYAELGEDIRKRIEAVLDHGKYIMGPEIGELEKDLAEFASSTHCVACASGTDALVMVLMAYGIGAGDAVFTTPFTYVATAEAIANVGAMPVFVDIEPDTFNMDPAKLQEAIAKTKAKGELKLRAVMPVDLFGLPVDYDRINAIAKSEDLVVIGDGAQAYGSEYKGKPSANHCDVYTTSFFPAKPLGCYGDGGAIFTDNAAFADILRSVRVHGSGEDKYDTIRLGINGRLDSIQAAVLLSKLPHFAAELEKRDQNARRYSDKLNDILTTPIVAEGYKSAWAQYSVLSEHRDAIREALQKEGIPSAVYYLKPLHLLTSFAFAGCGEGDFPVAEEASTKIFSLPMHPYLKDEDIDQICEIIRKTIESKS